MTTRNLKNLNAYPEFRTDAGINAVRAAVIAQAPPAGLTPARAARFTARFLNPVGLWFLFQQRKQERPGMVEIDFDIARQCPPEHQRSIC